MPPIAPGAARELSEILTETARLVAELGGLQATDRYPAHAHTYVERVTARFERINQTLRKARDAGHVTAAQQRSIATNLAAAAAAIEKAAGSKR